jgi:hypothetical protein
MVRSPLPAQDGLKLIRFAKQFQSQPWADVVRSSDVHPLYPALVATVEPVVARLAGEGPDSWRIASQLVSMLAAVALLWPLHSLAGALFDGRTATFAVFLYILLPVPAAIGHDTLTDSLASFFLISSLCTGERALRREDWRSALACGLIGGIGYLARPEVVLAPIVVCLVGATRAIRSVSVVERRRSFSRLAASACGMLLLIGVYTLIKGEVSEKLSLRVGMGTTDPSPRQARSVPQWLPTEFRGKEWDFSPKEESTSSKLSPSLASVVESLASDWIEGLGVVLVPLVFVGALRKNRDGSKVGRWLIFTYAICFVTIVCRHALNLGYLSGRHALGLVILSMPYAAFGMRGVARFLHAFMGSNALAGRRAALVSLALMLGAGVAAQAKGSHSSRWGHQEAARWLSENARSGDAVLDTRGWASFLKGGPSYDYWHVRQALTDRNLRYIVVTTDELDAKSPRAETLRTLLGRTSTKVAGFPEKSGQSREGVQVFRFTRPTEWERSKP